MPELFIAFAAGLLSFLSPCVLPLVPAYIGYLGGSGVRSSAGANRMMAKAGGVGTAGAATAVVARPSATARWLVLTNAFVFVLGFTLVFAIIGGLVGFLTGWY